MKRIGTLLIFVFGSVGYTVGQTYQDFPLDESATWRVDHGRLFNGCWVSDILNYHVAGDTILNGHEYSVINYTGISWSQPGEVSIGCWVDTHAVSGLHGFLRAEEGVVFRGYSTGEEVLFDFSMNVGDTLISQYTGGIPLVIDSIDTVSVSSFECRRLWFQENGIGTDQWMMEGVGSSYGLIDPMFFFEFNNTLRCYGHDGVPLVYDDLYYCDFTVGASEEIETVFELYPNPTNGFLQIDNLTSPTSFSIHNLLGKEVMSSVVSSNEFLDVSPLTNGIYLIRLNLDGKPAVRKFVKQ